MNSSLPKGTIVGIRPFSPISEPLAELDGLVRVVIQEKETDEHNQYVGYYQLNTEEWVGFSDCSIIKVYFEPPNNRLQRKYIQKIKTLLKATS